MKNLKVIDIFCGAGGFSEGFRQQGFEIILGIDRWEPAIKTFNHNFQLNCLPKDVHCFETSTEEIESLPDSEIIIGSPPCVSFSTSNKSGKADKSTGVRLTEIFLRIIAVKKYCRGSRLKAWFMENVVNSLNYLKDFYTFKYLNLSEWAKIHKLDPNEIAINLKDNRSIINSADYGSPQIRKRVISGEIIEKGRLIIPPHTHSDSEENSHLPQYITLGMIKRNLPSPNSPITNNVIIDPLYPQIKINKSELTDHFYDTGLFKCEWKQSRFLKINHPYMGRMSFPENEEKPSRTIMATYMCSSREAIIYKSEFDREDDGAYRIPTIRESACLMGFPITYQFIGSENLKCKLVGNAVCPTVSRALAKQVRKELGQTEIEELILNSNPVLSGVNNLNTFSQKKFNVPPVRNNGSRFRRHPFKDGNFTVTLSNYDIHKNEKRISKWITSVQYGNGKGFPTFNFHDGLYSKLEPVIAEVTKGEEFLEIINNGFSEKIGNSATLQDMYEKQLSKSELLEPTELVEEVSNIIDSLGVEKKVFEQKGQKIFKNKKVVPVKQLFALYAINKISSVANK